MKFFNYIIILCSFVFTQDELSSRYHSFYEIEEKIIEWDDQFGSNTNPYEIYPGDEGIIFHHEIIGYSEVDNLPIWALKLSFNADVDEDEPKVLLLGHVHAEEIYGIEIVMELIDRLLNPYPDHASSLQLIYEIMSKTEIWIIPTYNPDGLRMVHGYDDGYGWIQDVYYRKNKKDTNNNGIFDFIIGPGDDVDGVDLNRNFDLNWYFGDDFDTQDFGSCNPSYITNFDYYRGSDPFSESEVRTIRDFALENNFLLSIAYHSSRSGCVSEKVIYPWFWGESKPSPDLPIASRLGEQIAQLIPKEAEGGHYQPANSISRKGNAHDWFYKNTGCLQYLIETGTENIQPSDTTIIEDTIERNLVGVMHLLKRAASIDTQGGPEKHQISGLVTDENGNPIQAEITIVELDGSVLEPRYTNQFGRYRRLLIEGTYTLMVQAHGYETYIHEFVPSGSAIYEHNVQLVPSNMHQYQININKPDNYDLPIALEIQYFDAVESQENINNPYRIDTLVVDDSELDYVLYDNTLIRCTALGEYLFPESRYGSTSLFVDGTLDLNFDLVYEGVLFQDDFDNDDNWDLNSNWHVNNGYLVSRPSGSSFYMNSLNDNTIVNSSFDNYLDYPAPLVIEAKLKSELEWDNDYFYIDFYNASNINSYFSLSNQNWENNIIRTLSQTWTNEFGGPWDGNISMSMISDSTLTYRGVEIDYLKLLFKPDEGCNKGDVNHDGIVNVIDVVNIVNFIFEISTPEYYQSCASDMNGDDILNVLDVVLVVDSIFGVDN